VADKKILSQINVTPLVDVAFVLLIVFIITAPMLEEGIDVNLPKVEAGGLTTPREPVIITIDSKGDIYISKMKLTPAALGKKLEAIFKRRTDKMVLLRADAKVPYGFVAEAMAEIRKAGIVKIGMVTEPLLKKR
jgi:biopolymer transport protein TolR